jgi:putative oxidoreductase
MAQLTRLSNILSNGVDVALEPLQLEQSMVRDTGLLVLRFVQGGLMLGHGSQKLFGLFGGYGLQGTAGWLESLGLKPGNIWAIAAGGSEFVGGLLTTLGLFNPLGSIATISSMSLATTKAHWGKPIWVTEGGAELPVTNMAISLALALTGPGQYSLDEALGIRLPPWFTIASVLAAGAGIAYAIMSRPESIPVSEGSGTSHTIEGHETSSS